MNVPDLIEVFQAYLDEKLDPPVFTRAAEEVDPVPAIILDEIELNDQKYHNSELVQSVEHENQSDERWFHYHYELRLRWIARGSDDYQAARQHARLREALRAVQRNPDLIHDHVGPARLTDSAGQISYDFVENTEAEFGQVMIVRSFDEDSQADYDSLEAIQRDLQVTN